MTKYKTTNRPWSCKKSRGLRWSINDGIIDVWGFKADAEANARLIVKAVNCHEQLLDAIKASIGWLACGVDKNTQRNLRAITILKEALQRAESEG